MNIDQINKTIQERKQAADEAAKVQAVLGELDNLCREKGFESYAAFLSAANALSGGYAPRKAGGVAKRGRPAAIGKVKAKGGGERKQKRLTDEQKEALKKLAAGGSSASEISKQLGIGYQTAYLWSKKFAAAAK